MGQLLMQPVLVGESSFCPTLHRVPWLSRPDVLSSPSHWCLPVLSIVPLFLLFCWEDQGGDAVVTCFSTDFKFLLVPTAQGTPGMAPPPAPATASASAGTTNTATTAGPAPGGPAQPPPPQPSSDLQFSQLLGNLLGPSGPGAGGPGMASPTITVAMPGVPAFLQGMTDLLQVKTGLLFTSPFLSPSPAGPACLVAITMPLGCSPWWPVSWREPWEFIDPFWR